MIVFKGKMKHKTYVRGNPNTNISNLNFMDQMSFQKCSSLLRVTLYSFMSGSHIFLQYFVNSFKDN